MIMISHKTTSSIAAQDFFKDILDQPDYLENKKSVLRKRARLRQKDRRAAKLH